MIFTNVLLINCDMCYNKLGFGTSQRTLLDINEENSLLLLFGITFLIKGFKNKQLRTGKCEDAHRGTKHTCLSLNRHESALFNKFQHTSTIS